MNPFELYGPDFLYFYALLGGAAILALWLLQRGSGGDAPVLGGAGGLTSDAYMIAYLRGGEAELVRVTALSLFDRGFLSAPELQQNVAPGPGTRFVAAKKEGGELLRRPIEKEVHRMAAIPIDAKELVRNLHSTDASTYYQTALEHLGLLRTARELAMQQVYWMLA